MFKRSRIITVILIISWLVSVIPAGCKERIPDQQIKQHISEILQNPEYNRVYQKEIMPSWLERLIEFLNRLFGGGAINAGPSDASLILTIMTIIAIVLFLIVAVFVVSNIMKKQNNKFSYQEDDLLRQVGSSKKLITLADEYAKNGDFRNAIKFAYTAVLSVMDEKQIIVYDKTRTNRSYVYELKDKNLKSVADFETATNKFDKTIYGFFESTQLDFSFFKNYYNLILSEKAV
jgi:preprotein translocase subunit SecG